MANTQTKTAQKPAQAQAAKPNQELVERKASTAVSTGEEIPDYIKRGTARGNENVEMADMVIPRIEIAQALSKCLKPTEPQYIEGIVQGEMYNTVTRQNYGSAMRVVPIFFKKEWLAWRDQKKGGGFAGAHATVELCQAAIDEQEHPDEWEATETAQQLVIVIKEDGTTEEAVVSMSKTKLKVSKQWNSLVRLTQSDRFARQYVLHTSEETNNNNQTYQNFGVMPNGYPAADVYKKAEALYTALSTGARRMNIDASDLDEAVVGGQKESGEY